MLNFPDSDHLISYEFELRSRYSETDKMGYVYHGKFLEYFEVARVEMIRSYGIDYRQMEDDGIMLPVIEANLEFKSPVYYDEPIKIIVSIFEKPGIRLRTFYQVIAKDRDVLCARAQVTLFFMDENTRKPTRAPSYFSEKFDAAVQLANSK
ncbi:MAG: acyl-CoA thioesterase [Balneolaceae bacterium]